ncbi:MAG: hypothetical protein ABR548_01710 [Actinomycetota bacterium]
MRTGLKTKIVGLLAATGIIAAAAFGLTASNTVAASSSGAGEGTISGYTISNVAYTLDSTSPDTVSAVSFRVATDDVSSTSAFAISAKLDSKWSANCDTRTFETTYTSVTCSYTGSLPAVETADSLRVVVAAK